MDEINVLHEQYAAAIYAAPESDAYDVMRRVGEFVIGVFPA